MGEVYDLQVCRPRLYAGGERCQVFSWWTLCGGHHRHCTFQSAQSWAERWIPHSQDWIFGGQEGIEIFLHCTSAWKSKSKSCIMYVYEREREKSPVFHSAIICIFVFRLKERSWQSSWNCMTLCMIRPWPGSLHLKMIWRVKSSATLGSCLPKTLTHRWMFAPNQSHICSKCSFIVILPPALSVV